MHSLLVPEDVFAFFASDPVGPMSSVLSTADNHGSGIFDSFDRFLKSIPDDMVGEARADGQFQWFWKAAADIDRMARIWIAERYLSFEIARRRLAVLRSDTQGQRLPPYNQPSTSDLEVDEEGMVRLSEFEFDGSRLIRNGYAFTVFCTTPSPNSTYWLTNTLVGGTNTEMISVRLDPFLFGPEHTFPAMFYRMWQYGRPLDWERISRMSECDFGRWLPESSLDHGKFTDFFWQARYQEKHFVCEEIPNDGSVDSEAARYLHAIYLGPRSEGIHLDGALRLYTADELLARSSIHLRNSGKCGLRRKIFRTDQPISRTRLSAIAQSFYVWNRDVERYFLDALSSERPPANT
jgi:hypothetical protein